MIRFLSLSLTAALFCAFVTVAVQGQGRGGGRGQQAAALPDGQGKNVVEASCTACHGLNQITGTAGYGQDDWQLPGARRRGIWSNTKELLDLGRDEIIDQIKSSNLRGRGGAGHGYPFLPRLDDERSSRACVHHHPRLVCLQRRT